MNVFRFIIFNLLFSLSSCFSGDDKNNLNSFSIQEKNPYDTALYYVKGQKIFITECNACHVAKGKLHNYLESVVQRVGEDYVKLYLTKQDSLIQSKDKYALSLKEVWGNQGNSHNFKYSKQQLNELIEYLR